MTDDAVPTDLPTDVAAGPPTPRTPHYTTADLQALFDHHTPAPEVLAEDAAAGTRVLAGSLGDLDVLRLDGPGGSSFVTPFGAQVLSWRPTGGDDALFLSSRAALDGSTAIRGGVPVCWPWFGPRAQPQHGWARIDSWILDAFRATDTEAAVRFAYTREGAAALVTVRVDTGLTVQLEHKADAWAGTDAPEEVTAALHTYFLVGDHRHVTVYGIPNGADDPMFDQAIGPRVYPAEGIDTVRELGTPFERDLDVVDGSRTLRVVADGSDVVMWNPATGLGDTTPDAFTRFVCLEPARVSTPMAPGDVLSFRLEVG
ncbi:hypothetical protein [Brevibacterium litoralis]|uniref:aldose epimerase family protein n=1 Tax=Brevibacterium litoralis TaxID=3138935 RepID=UPI0032EEA226